MTLGDELKEVLGGKAPTSGLLREGRYVGAVFGEPGLSGRQEKVAIRGFNVAGKGDVRLMPRVSGVDLDVMDFHATQSYSEYVEAVLARFCRKRTTYWDEYMALKTAKRVEAPDGSGRYQVVKNFEPDVAPKSELQASGRATNAKVKQYTLAQLFSDAFVREKYSVNEKFRRDMQMLAMTDPESAAGTFQAYLQRKSPKVKVVVKAGGYAKSAHRAAGVIRNLYSAIPPGSAAVDAIIVGKQVFMQGFKADGGKWWVKGPLAHAQCVSEVYRLAEYGGLRETMFLLGEETLTLGIDVYDGNDCVSSICTGHARDGDYDMEEESSPETLDLMSDYAKDRMSSVKENVLPVHGEGGLLASALRVEDRLVLFNDHVLRYDPTAEVNGVALAGHVPVSSDVWAQYDDGPYAAWAIGDAKVGDSVAVLYHNGEHAVLSPPLVVQRVDGVKVVTNFRSEVGPGTSGGALVSLSDFALLGIHTGAMSRALIFSTVSEQRRLELIETLEQGRVRVEASAAAADNVLQQLKAKGLHKGFLQTVSSAIPLHAEGSGHVGTALAIGGKLVTTCQPGRYESNRGQHVFADPDGFYSCSLHESVSSTGLLPQVRVPQVSESVIIAVATRDGPYVTEQTRVRQVAPGGKAFFLDLTKGNLFSLTGGIVFSVADGAALGMFCRDTTVTTGGGSILSMCAVFPEFRAAPVDPVAIIQSAFPMFHVDQWDSQRLASACRHGSLAHEGDTLPAQALLGDSYLRYMLYRRFTEAGVPYSRWNARGVELQCNSRMSELAWELGLYKVLRSQAGLNFNKGSKAHADLLEALMCVAAEEESEDVMDKALDMVGLVPGAGRCAEGEPGTLMRRGSEFSVGLSGDGSLLTPVD